jgi:hypothetical protein
MTNLEFYSKLILVVVLSIGIIYLMLKTRKLDARSARNDKVIQSIHRSIDHQLRREGRR